MQARALDPAGDTVEMQARETARESELLRPAPMSVGCCLTKGTLCLPPSAEACWTQLSMVHSSGAARSLGSGASCLPRAPGLAGRWEGTYGCGLTLM